MDLHARLKVVPRAGRPGHFKQTELATLEM
jgi:hypothetical protein